MLWSVFLNAKKILYTLSNKTILRINMKFLIIQKVKRDVPLEKWSRLLPLQFKYFEKLEAEGTLEVYYHLIGQQGSMLIVNADSDEKLSKVIGQDPLFFDLEREIYPLTTRQTHERQIRELLGQR
jgi:muconolactone delta-isomerase